MIINWKLAQEIYGLTPWFVDAKSFPAMSSVLRNMKNGINLENSEEKLNQVSYYIPNSTRTVDRPYGNYYNPGQLENKEQFEAIGIININGPITKSGGMSSYGMDYVSALMNKMVLDDRIKGFLIVGNSGGGSSSAVEIMDDTILSINKIKPVHSLVEKGGMAASAMYGIMSGSRKIYSESLMNIVGSVGTMIQFEGRAANTTSPDGIKNIRVYATKSIKKNEDFEQALNHDNYELLVSELLDPVNENFINMIQRNRPILAGTDFDNGNTKFAKDAIGSYIDGIKTFNEAVEAVMTDYKVNYQTKEKKEKKNSNINPKPNNSMTLKELKNEHPEVFQEAFDAGVASEKDRTGVWMAHFDSDPEKVRDGIKSGNNLSGAEREELIVAASAKAALGKIEAGNAPVVAVTESAEIAETTAEEKELDEMFKGL